MRSDLLLQHRTVRERPAADLSRQPLMLVHGGSMKLRLALLTFSIMLFSPLYAADIYRWVDENGRIQFSDVVPEKYKKSAKRMDSRQYELSPEQRKEAEGPRKAGEGASGGGNAKEGACRRRKGRQRRRSRGAD